MLDLYPVFEGAYLFVFAVIIALHEIEIEGENGWAEKLPTWKASDITRFSLYSNHPLTGYHLTLGVFLWMAFHLQYVFGTAWTLPSELFTLSKLAMLAVVWDYLWFVLNPEFGYTKFKKENVPWHDTKWLMNSFPITYANILAGSVLCAYLASYLNPEIKLVEYWTLLGLQIPLTVLTVLLSPYYHSFREKML